MMLTSKFNIPRHASGQDGNRLMHAIVQTTKVPVNVLLRANDIHDSFSDTCVIHYANLVLRFNDGQKLYAKTQ